MSILCFGFIHIVHVYYPRRKAKLTWIFWSYCTIFISEHQSTGGGRVEGNRIFCFGFWNVYITFEPPHDKTNKMSVRPAKTQISLGIRPVWSESSLCVCAQWMAKDPSLWTAKMLIRLGRCPGWSESSQGAQPLCWFCHVVAHLFILHICLVCIVSLKW